VREREAFRTSLRATLVKDARHLPLFDELFPFFFDTSGAPPLLNLSQDLSPQEAGWLAEALRQFNDRLRQALQRLLNGEPLTPEELERLAQMVGLNNTDNMRYRQWMGSGYSAPWASVRCERRCKSWPNCSSRWA
jgi:uncharacterized protein with von Willebrand factor type A (vWA) domain